MSSINEIQLEFNRTTYLTYIEHEKGVVPH